MSERFQKYRFEDLEVWQIGMKIVHECYVLTKNFPKNEVFALSDQLQRASTSICLNLAEGTGQPTSKGFAVYIQRSKSSTLECVACIKIALQENFIKDNDVISLMSLFQEEYFKLIALNKSIK
ncbi:MAG: four helix bundle protein [Candidatus Paceibacterota bacterium]|jgi:four helix bundle protein